MTLLDPRQLTNLPLWAQVLLASRLLERYRLALTESEVDRVFAEDAELALLALQDAAAYGGQTNSHRRIFGATGARRHWPAPLARLASAMRQAIEAAKAAEAALDLPVDASVTASLQSALADVLADPRVNRLQFLILFRADVEQLRFACSEVGVGTYDALPSHVFGRLTPLHALTLQTPIAQEPAWR